MYDDNDHLLNINTRIGAIYTRIETVSEDLKKLTKKLDSSIEINNATNLANAEKLNAVLDKMERMSIRVLHQTRRID